MAFVSSSKRWRGCPRLSCARLQLPLSPYWTNGCRVARRFSIKQHTQDMTSTNDLITSTCSTAVFSAASCVDWEAKLAFHWMNMGKFLFLAAKSIFFISQFSEQHTSSPPGSLPRPPSSSSEPRSGANPNRFGPVIVCGFSKVFKLFKWFVKVVKYTDWMTPGIFFLLHIWVPSHQLQPLPFHNSMVHHEMNMEMDFDTCGSFFLSTTHQFYVIFKQPSIQERRSCQQPLDWGICSSSSACHWRMSYPLWENYGFWHQKIEHCWIVNFGKLINKNIE